MEEQLILSLGYKFCTLFIFAFILSKLDPIKNVIRKYPVNTKEKIILAIIFGIFGIAGTYFSVNFKGALINTRVIGVATGGILGGPLVGFISGVIAGVHRFLMPTGKYTAFACAVSVPLEGLVAGLMSKWILKKNKKWMYAALVGAICESMRKVSLLIFCKPFSKALDLVLDIWFPTVLINSLGLALLFMIVDSVFKEREKEGATQVNLSLNIVDKILPYLKMGLESEKVGKIAEIIYQMTDFDAVTITDKEKIIAHAGECTQRHRVGSKLVTVYLKNVLKNGEIFIIDNCDEPNCDIINCKLKSAIIVPLKDGDNIVGTMKFYKFTSHAMTSIDIETCKGLSKLCSTQLKIGRLEANSQLLVAAELKALQAQINPHFLFNSLMVIASLCRINPNKARELIIHLSNHFRKNLTIDKELIDLEDELDHVKSYVEIEKARFEDKLVVIYNIEENIECYLPPLTLQPIVENAIKHGILPKKEGGKVMITANIIGVYIVISVHDNGKGMEKEKINKIFDINTKHINSIGLNNVNKRLKGIFGESYKMKIDSEIGKWTNVEISILKNVFTER